MPIRSLEGMPLHTRALSIAITREADTASRPLWHARGDIIDLRKNGFVPTSYDVQPSGIIHSMNIDLAFDPETLRIERISVDQPFIAIEASEATAGECCRDPAPRLLDLKGECLDSGFTQRLGAHFGGPLGCSHLLTLFQLMASTIPRAVELERAREAREGSESTPGTRFFRRSLFVDGHLRNDNRIDAAIQLADTHLRPRVIGDPYTKQLESSHEWKLRATVERKRFQIENLSAAERLRDFETLGSAEWIAHDEAVAPLFGVPVIPGLAGRVFGLLGGATDLVPMRDALLQLAPGFIQIVAALMDDYFQERARAESDASRPKPEVASVGGNTNSCYMWREDGAIANSWNEPG